MRSLQQKSGRSKVFEIRINPENSDYNSQGKLYHSVYIVEYMLLLGFFYSMSLCQRFVYDYELEQRQKLYHKVSFDEQVS